MQTGAGGAMGALPRRVDLRPLLPAARDQGKRGTCLAFAVTAAHEFARAAGSTVTEDLAEEVLYWGSKQIDGDYAPGSYFSSAAAALAQWGQPAEHLWRYDCSRDDTNASYKPPSPALDPAACNTARLREVGVDVAEIRHWLAASRPVALGIMLTQGFQGASDGHIPVPNPEDAPTEGHAILIVGYEDGPEEGEGVLIFRNSWGSDWGEEGYGYLPYTYIERHAGEAWIID